MGQLPKYYPLQRYLEAATGAVVTLSFAELEAIIGAPLPQTAWRRAWWTNRPHQPQARAWLAAGWQARAVHLRPWQVRFVRVVEGKPDA